jgi:hypothetical protein
MFTHGEHIVVAKLAELDGTGASSAAQWGDEGPHVERSKDFYGQQVDGKRWVWRELGRCKECGGSVIGTREVNHGRSRLDTQQQRTRPFAAQPCGIRLY